MKHIYFYLLIFFISFSKAQDSIPSSIINKFNTNYKDFSVVQNKVYALTKGDSLIAWDFTNGNIELIKNDISSIASKNNILFTTTCKEKVLYKYEKAQWEILDSVKGEVFKILVDENNHPIVITKRGFYIKGKMLSPNTCKVFHPKNIETLDEKNLKKPTLSYLDKNNRIWLTYDNGEWGADTWFYDPNTNELFEEEYLDLEVDYNEFKDRNRYKADLIKAFPEKIKIFEKDTLYKFPAHLPIYYGIKGITEDNKSNIYISQSLMHFSVDATIEKLEPTQFKNFYRSSSLKQLIDNEIVDTVKFKDSNGNIKIYGPVYDEEYLGPISYNPFNKSINYYTNNGFFEIVEDENEYSKKLLINPKLIWKYGMSNAVGYKMAIKKFVFLNEHSFVFLTNLNGIGFFDGKQIIYLR